MESVYSFAEMAIHHLWSVSWQVTILVAIIWLVDRLSFRASSLFRYWLWMIVLVRLCIPVNLTVPAGIERFLEQSIGKMTPDIGNYIPYQNLSGEFSLRTILLNHDEGMPGETSVIKPVKHSTDVILPAYYGFIWLSAVLLITTFLFSRLYQVRRLLKGGVPVRRADVHSLMMKHKRELGIRSHVRLYSMDTDTFDIPAVIGIRNHCIILPVSIVNTWTAEEIEPVLLHELAHIKRFDLFVNLFQIIIQVVYFFHPLVWFTNRRIRQMREEVCDDIAVQKLGRGRSHYTLSILRIMENSLHETRLGFVGIGFSEKKSTIGERIKRIMNAKYRNTTNMTVLSVTALVIISIFAILLSCENSSLEDSTSQNDAIVAKHDGQGIESLNDNQLLHIKKALVHQDYPGNYTFKTAIGVAKGEHLLPSEEVLGAVRNVVESVDRYTMIQVELNENIDLDSQVLHDIPILFIATDNELKLSHLEIKNLCSYLRNGGFTIIVSGAYASEESAVLLKYNLVANLGLNANPSSKQIPNDHPLYHCFFDFDDGPPQGAVYKPHIEGICYNNRLAAVISSGGFTDKWKDGVESAPQLKFGVNLAVCGFIQTDSIIRDDFLSASLPEIKKVEIFVKILEDGDYLVNDALVASTDLEKVLKEKIGKSGTSDFTVDAQVRIHSDIFDQKVFNATMHTAFNAGANGVGTF